MNPIAPQAPLSRLQQLLLQCPGMSSADRVRQTFFVVSPYRFNPLGAHVDHQGGPVLARTLDHYTLLPFTPLWNHPVIELSATSGDWPLTSVSFHVGETGHSTNWVRYAQAAAAAFAAVHPVRHGFSGHVAGTLVGAGLSSSASVVLAYLQALAHCNAVELTARELVELSRQVENEFMGLNNGIQDQMSVVYGRPCALSLLDVTNASARSIADPVDAEKEVAWLLFYSGFSRELISSGFNTRVAECREAARALDPQADVLCAVRADLATPAAVDALRSPLAGRARHFLSESARVHSGVTAWQSGHYREFGQLMNASCRSSIDDYQSGSQPLIDLHEIASGCDGVLGSRFSGGGYGGCLIVLAEQAAVVPIQQRMMDLYLEFYPEKRGIARTFVAAPEGGVRVTTNLHA